MTGLVLSPVERAGLTGHLHRVLGLDGRAVVRLQAQARVVGVWSSPPLGVLALRPVALLDPLELDATVPAQRLLDALAATDAADGSTAVPGEVVGPPWAALLPPRAGWELVAEVPVGLLADQVGVLVEGFRRRAELVPAGGRTTSTLAGIAEGLWSEAAFAGIPMRATHAAALLGLLGRDGQAQAWSVAGWLRLGCPGGSVLVRAGHPLDRLDDLDVLGIFTGPSSP